jgi:hypothetical protein
MSAMARNIAAKPVGTPEAKTWKSRVNATMSHVRSRFGSLNLDVRLIWPAETIVFRGFTCATREVFADVC